MIVCYCLSLGRINNLYENDLMIQPYKETYCYQLISGSITSTRVYRDVRVREKIAIFSAFVKSNDEFNYHDRIYNWLSYNGYSVLLVLPEVDGVDIDDESLSNACDTLISRKNIGYDFGSYAAGLLYLDDCRSMKDILFINDSCIGPFGEANSIDEPAEFWANTDSHQIKYHYQSYLFGFKVTEVTSPIIAEFFFGRGSVYSNERSEIIQSFELEMYDFFLGRDFSCGVVHSGVKLKDALRGRLRNMQCIISFEYFYSLWVLLWKVNPTHHLWLELFNNGHPFIKKELFRDNPNNYPKLSDKIHQEMRKCGCEDEYKKIFQVHL